MGIHFITLLLHCGALFHFTLEILLQDNSHDVYIHSEYLYSSKASKVEMVSSLVNHSEQMPCNNHFVVLQLTWAFVSVEGSTHAL